MKKNSVVKCIAVPAVLTLSLGGALLAVVPANAATSAVTTAAVAPAAAAASTFAVTTPGDGSTVSSRTVTFSGTGTDGQPVNILNAAGTRIVQATPGANGSWSGTYTFADTDATTQVLSANEINVGPDGASRNFTITLPSVAPAATFAVTSPANGSTVASRTVTFSGTGHDGQPVNILKADGTRILQAIPNADGNWSGTYTFADTDSVTQVLSANEINVGTDGASRNFTITLPAAAPVSSNTLTLTSPAEGSTTASRTVTFTGTAPATSIVTILDGSGKEIGRSNGSIDGTTFSIPVTYSATAPVAQKVTASSFAGGRGADNQVIRDFNLPAAATAPTQTIATPKITSPANGAKITGKQVTFTGTGTPGANIVVAVVPTAEVKSLQAQAAKSMSSAMRVAPRAATPTDPANPIVVNAKGVWTVTVALKAGDYTADAASVLLDSNGDPVLGTDGNPVVAGPSNVVEFVLADAVTTAATGTTTPTTGSLAFTGSNAAPEVGIAAALLALGGGLMAAARRRRRFMK